MTDEEQEIFNYLLKLNETMCELIDTQRKINKNEDSDMFSSLERIDSKLDIVLKQTECLPNLKHEFLVEFFKLL
jgi:hypothetical protein